MKKTSNKKGYPWTLKEFPDGPVLKKDGKPFKYGSIIPLVGGESLGSSMATGKKPDFLLSFTPFAWNESFLRDYWPDVPYFNLDEFLEGENPRNLNELSDYFKDVDFINAVPPCAGLSSLNASCGRSEKSRGADAVQNEWLYKSSRFILEHVKPKVLWGENAPALFTKTGKGVADKLAEIAKEYGYSFSLMKTNTLHHGIPQKRERTHYFFWNSETAPIMNYYHRDLKSLNTYLNQLPKGLEHENDVNQSNIFDKFPSYKWLLDKLDVKDHATFVEEHGTCTLHGYIVWKGMGEEAIKYIESIDPNHNELRYIRHAMKKVNDSKGWWDASPHFFKDHFNALVARNMWCGTHPVEERFLNVREMIWLMGHPWDFNLRRNENGGVSTNVIAQNVPVLTSRDWCLEVMKFINGELPRSNEIYLRQNNNKPVEKNTAKNLF